MSSSSSNPAGSGQQRRLYLKKPKKLPSPPESPADLLGCACACACGAEGAAAARPCSGGTYSNATDNNEASDCTDVDPGYFATTGSTVQRVCAKGTFTDASTTPKDSCTPCAASTYQDAQGATACKACEAGCAQQLARSRSAPLMC